MGGGDSYREEAGGELSRPPLYLYLSPLLYPTVFPFLYFAINPGKQLSRDGWGDFDLPLLPSKFKTRIMIRREEGWTLGDVKIVGKERQIKKPKWIL